MIHRPNHEENLLTYACIAVSNGRPASWAETALDGMLAVGRSFEIDKGYVSGKESDESGNGRPAGPPAVRAMTIGGVEWLRGRFEPNGSATATACMSLQDIAPFTCAGFLNNPACLLRPPWDHLYAVLLTTRRVFLQAGTWHIAG